MTKPKSKVVRTPPVAIGEVWDLQVEFGGPKLSTQWVPCFSWVVASSILHKGLMEPGLPTC